MPIITSLPQKHVRWWAPHCLPDPCKTPHSYFSAYIPINVVPPPQVKAGHTCVLQHGQLLLTSIPLPPMLISKSYTLWKTQVKYPVLHEASLLLSRSRNSFPCGSMHTCCVHRRSSSLETRLSHACLFLGIHYNVLCTKEWLNELENC
jgi:hypothetical protein